MSSCGLSKHQQSMSKINPHTQQVNRKCSISFPQRKTKSDQLSVFACFVCAEFIDQVSFFLFRVENYSKIEHLCQI